MEIDDIVNTEPEKEKPKIKPNTDYPGWAFNLTNNPPLYHGWGACVQERSDYQCSKK